MCPPLRLAPTGMLTSIEIAWQGQKRFQLAAETAQTDMVRVQWYTCSTHTWRPAVRVAIDPPPSDWAEFKRWYAKRYGPIGDE